MDALTFGSTVLLRHPTFSEARYIHVHCYTCIPAFGDIEISKLKSNSHHILDHYQLCYNCLNFHIWWCSIYYCLLVDPHIFCKGFYIIWEIIGHEKAFLLISERLAKCSTHSEALCKHIGFLLKTLPLITLFDRKMPIKEIHLDRILKEMELTQEQVCEYANTSHMFANNV